METVYPVATFKVPPRPLLPSIKSDVTSFRFLHSHLRNKQLEFQNHGFSSQFIFRCSACSKFLVSQSEPERLKCAQQLFDNFPNRDVISWSALIAAYSRCGNFAQAFGLFQKMVGEGLQPNGFSLASLLKVSSSTGEIGLSRQLHGWSIRTGFGLDSGIRAAWITMYSRCGVLEDAQRVFDETSLLALDILLWNSIIGAYIFHGCWVEVLRLFCKMVSVGVVAPTELTYASVVNACGSSGEEKYGAMVHGRIIKAGLEATNLWNSLVTFYGKCGNLQHASHLFERISRKDVVSWNAMIAANEQRGEGENALGLFRRMLKIESPVQPNRVTFLSLLSAVSGLSALRCGREIHAHIIRLSLEVDTSIANCLITFYSKCREVGKAREIFERLLLRDIISWNSMLAGYEQNEQQGRCFDIFKRMMLSGIEPDSHSLTIIFNAASRDSSGLIYFRRGKEIHGYILRRITPGGVTLSVSNAMLKMYAKFNRIADAEKIFKGMKNRDSYSWNAMMDGYSRNAKFEDVLMIFLDILKQGFPLDHLSLSILLTSCGRLVSLQLGKQFHAVVAKLFNGQDCPHQDSLLSINNALISMYSKCGSIKDAAQVFLKMERKDVFSWTAMITGCAHHGMAVEALQLFERMKTDGIKPNQVTFLALLMACAHGGLVQEGSYYFDSMYNDYGLSPSIEHYACMIDLFGRSGQFDRAKSLVEFGITLFKPYHDDILNLWKVLLGACHASKQLDLGVEAATKILELEPEDEATYILLANLYASSGLWEDAIKVRKTMRDKGLRKEVGCSWIDTGNRRHIFVAGDVCHPQRKEIYEKLARLNYSCRRMGYVPMTELVLHDVDETEKEAILGCHSEKLAVSFGLLNCGVGNGVIRVMKNLRVCEDCHSWMKFASLLEKREILLRDSQRFHLFRDGSCSCGGYW